MIDHHIAVGRILGTEEYEADTKLVAHELLEFLFVGSHIAVLLQDGTELGLASLIGSGRGLAAGFDHRERDAILNETCTFEDDGIVLTVALIAHRFEDGHVLLDGAETIVESLGSGLTDTLVLVLTKEAVDDILRTAAFVIVVYLVAIGSHTAGDDVDVVVPRIVVCIDEQGLTRQAITHLVHVAVGKADQLFMGHLMTTTGESNVELGLLDAVVLSGIVAQEGNQVVGRVFAHVADVAKVEHLDKLSLAFCDLLFIVGDGVEIIARWKDGCYHNM